MENYKENMDIINNFFKKNLNIPNYEENNSLSNTDKNYLELQIINEVLFKGFTSCLNFFNMKYKLTGGGFLSPIKKLGNNVDILQKDIFGKLSKSFTQFNIEEIICNLSKHIYNSLITDFFSNKNISPDKQLSYIIRLIIAEEKKLRGIMVVGGKKLNKKKSNKIKTGGTGFEVIVISGIIIGAILALIQIFERIEAWWKKRRITDKMENAELKEIEGRLKTAEMRNKLRDINRRRSVASPSRSQQTSPSRSQQTSPSRSQQTSPRRSQQTSPRRSPQPGNTQSTFDNYFWKNIGFK